MAKKKSKRHQSTSQDFTNNPFKNLEGLSALEAESSKSTCTKFDQEQPAEGNPGHVEEQVSFADEMAFLGVRRLGDDGPCDLTPATKTKCDMSPADESHSEASEQQTFLDAIGTMGKVFKNECVADVSARRAVPRRMKQVAHGQLKPEDQLDLHGMTVDEATARVLFFLQNSICRGFRTVLLITGKGLHSESGPVLRSAMERLLSDQNVQVVEWGVAPRRYGGEGALVVFLRQTE